MSQLFDTLLDTMENFDLQWDYTSYDDADFQEVSEVALNELKKAGYTNVTNHGGYDDLVKKGLK